MSRKLKSILTQAISGYGVTALGLVQGLFLLPFYLKYIDLATYGSWITIYSILNLMMLINIGINDFSISQMSNDYANQKFARLRGFFRTSMKTYIILSSIYVLLSLVILKFLGIIIILDHYTWDLKVCLLAAGFGGGLSIINQGLIDFSNSILRPLVPAICKFTSQLVGILITIIIMITQQSIFAIPVGVLFAEALSLIILSIFTYYQFLKINFQGPKQIFSIVEFLKISPAMAGATIGNKIIEELPNILILRNFGAENVAIYSITKKIADILIKIIRVSVIAFLPVLSNIAATTNYQKTEIFLNQIFNLFCIFVFIFFTIYSLFNENFILLWIDIDINIDANLILFVAISTALFSLLEVLKYLHYAKQSYIKPALITFFTGIMFGALLIPAIREYGVNGAPKLLFFIMLISVSISYFLFNRKIFILPSKIACLKLSFLILVTALISDRTAEIGVMQTWLQLISAMTFCIMILNILCYVSFKPTVENILFTLSDSRAK